MVQNLLLKLKIKPNHIIETIVSTYNLDKTPNAAPMGIIFQNDNRLIIRPFIQTQTYKNLKHWKCCTINLTSNPKIFFQTTFKNSKLPKKWFKKAKNVDAPKLVFADAFIEAEVKKVKVEKERAKIFCKTVNFDVKTYPSYGYCRANFAVIESIIHATRVKQFLVEGKKQEAEKLLNLINHYHALVKRVAPKSNYLRTMNNLIKILKR